MSRNTVNHAEIIAIIVAAGVDVMSSGCAAPECSVEPDYRNSNNACVMFGTLHTTDATAPRVRVALRAAGFRTRSRGDELVVSA